MIADKINDKEKVLELIYLGNEGEYWDFKEEWHESNVELIYDILCMANNLANKDAYLIIGVRDDGEICGVRINDPNRKDSSKINDLLANKSFAGDSRPTVKVDSFEYNGKRVEFIKVFNSNTTPFFLREDLKENNSKNKETKATQKKENEDKTKDKRILSNHVYTRIMDKNTAKNSLAAYDKQEYLWKKRFGIEKPIIERLGIHLDGKIEDWGTYSNDNNTVSWVEMDFGNHDIVFHKFFPEFRIEKVNNKGRRNSFDNEGYCDFYPDPKAFAYTINFYYLTTLIYMTKFIKIDQRIFIPEPSKSHFKNPKGWKDHGSETGCVYFYYYLKNSLQGKLLKLLTKGKNEVFSRYYTELTWLIMFENEDELEKFIEFSNNNPDLYDETIKNVNFGLSQDKIIEAHSSKYILQAQHFLGVFRKSNEIRKNIVFD